MVSDQVRASHDCRDCAHLVYVTPNKCYMCLASGQRVVKPKEGHEDCKDFELEDDDYEYELDCE